MNKLTEVILNNGDVVSFVPLTTKYGLAEFEICPVVKRGKLTDIYITPAQQPMAEHFYHIIVNYNPWSWSVGSWMHKGMEAPRVWNMYWCKTHKCQCFRVYVPRNSTKFSVELLTNLSIMFDK